ncbi:anti-sigma factor [Williamsia sp. CHRR-6]|uniref:anti-sigma factor n=1 Tax=Williamsia sp. CHRR-6 TaxID=2835871 RepID=UPI001BDB0183|nr:anti-sigma factor [Williamsia sp. CHRR-6]MBT0567316.1 anti-sigma factor [Williamsia sp. CHRR-6]
MRPEARPYEVVDDLLELYAINALSPDEVDQFELALLAIDHDQRVAAITEIRRTREAVARMAAEASVAPSEALRGRVLAVVESSAPDATAGRHAAVSLGSGEFPVPSPPTEADPNDELAQRRKRRQRIAVSVSSAAAAVLLVTGGIVIGRSTVDSPAPTTPATVTQADAALDQMRTVMSAPDTEVHRTKMSGSPGTMVIAASRTLDKAVVLLDDTPAPPMSRTYQLWLIDNAQGPRPAGLVIAAGKPVILAGLGDSRAVGMTIEPVGGSPKPTGEVLAAVPI